MIDFAWFFLGMYTGTVLCAIAVWLDHLFAKREIKP